MINDYRVGTRPNPSGDIGVGVREEITWKTTVNSPDRSVEWYSRNQYRIKNIELIFQRVSSVDLHRSYLLPSFFYLLKPKKINFLKDWGILRIGNAVNIQREEGTSIRRNFLFEMRFRSQGVEGE